MKLFGTRRPQFTTQEITSYILLAASIENLAQLGLNSNPQMEAAIAKAKSVCKRTETDNGFDLYCPPIDIVGG